MITNNPNRGKEKGDLEKITHVNGEFYKEVVAGGEKSVAASQLRAIIKGRKESEKKEGGLCPFGWGAQPFPTEYMVEMKNRVGRGKATMDGEGWVKGGK